MRRIVLVCALAIVLFASVSQARTWYILPDGTGDRPSIQEGIRAADPGDTVLVAPGSYSETVIPMKGGVTLLSEGGRDVTFLEPLVTWSPIIRCANLATGAEITGFTLLNGYALQAGAISCENATVDIAENRFLNNYTATGGAIYVSPGGMVTISDNVFESNTGEDWAGAVFCDASSPLIERNTFTLNEAHYGAAIGCQDGAAPMILDNLFHRNHSTKQGGCIHSKYDTSPVIHGNVFLDNSAVGGGGAIVVHSNTMAEITGNVFAANSALAQAAIGVSLDSHVICENNTFLLNQASGGGSCIASRSGSTVEVYNCIFEGCSSAPVVAALDGGTAILDCNDFWGNTLDYLGCTPGPNDFSACPSFCNSVIEPYDLQLCDESPCLPGNHPEGANCGLIGALGVGCSCGPSQTESTTWGAIKSIYK